MNSGICSRCSRSSSWSSGYSARYFRRGGEEPSGGLLTGGEEERRRTHDRGDVGSGAVGVLGEREIGEDVGPRLPASVLDVGREVVVEPGQRVESRHTLRAQLTGRSGEPEPLAEPLEVGLGHAQQVGHDEHGEGLGVGADELAAAVGDELVELPVGVAPHELFVLLQAPRAEEPHQQRPLASVLGRVHGDHVLVHRQLVAVALDDLADVVTLQRHGEHGERSDHGVARRERLDVAVDLGRLVVARDRHHPVMRDRGHRALRPQALEVGIRVLQQGRVGEEVEVFEISRHAASQRFAAAPLDIHRRRSRR